MAPGAKAKRAKTLATRSLRSVAPEGSGQGLAPRGSQLFASRIAC